MPLKVTRDVFQAKKFKKAREVCLQQFMEQNVIAPEEMQMTLDSVGISREAYTTLYGTMQNRLKTTKVKGSLLPKPFYIRTAKYRANENIMKILGDPQFVEGVYPGQKGAVKYDRYNNLYLDLKTVQREMIKFYNLSLEESEGIAKFVVKLDECEILKNRKLERVSITLMNRALAYTEGKRQDNFSVQSENNIWWLGAFEVEKEDHEILQWYFSKTTIPETIEAQTDGAVLEVEGLGAFKVEWHMAGDLKTLKCMYNISKGGNSKTPCLYCMQQAKHCSALNFNKQPDRERKDRKFHAIFKIPLSNVHICTLHALCRIVEKLVYLYIGYAWKIKNPGERERAIKQVEAALSEAGLHGGNVRIEADDKKSQNGNSVPRKPSIGGVKARRFFAFYGRLGKINQKKGSSTIKYDMWKVLHNAVKDHGDDGNTRNRKAEVWRSLDSIFKFCNKEKWDDKDHDQYKKTLKSFISSFKGAWNENNITHYMVNNTHFH